MILACCIKVDASEFRSAVAESRTHVGYTATVPQVSTVAVDVDGDGIADAYVSGIDRDRDGIPDALQVALDGMQMASQSLQQLLA